MTASVQPDASTDAAAAAMYHAQNAANGQTGTWAELEQSYRELWLTIAAAATPVIAAAVEAQARADERERVLAYIDGKQARIGFSVPMDKGIRWTLSTIRMMPVGWQPSVTGACRLEAHSDCRLPTCICACHFARARTSGVTS